jgi:arylsulfatase A-like enzyme
MNRREFLSLSAAALLPQSGRAPGAGRPNILFILADDLGYGDLGCYGQKRVRTPNVDRLAREGMRFTQAYAGSTVCAPSRCCLMTGMHTGHATIRGNKKPEVGLRANETTLASLLKQAGYRTALFGKWGLGGPGTGSVPNTRGFDQFYGYLDQQHAHNYYPEHLWDNQNEALLTGNWFGQRKDYAPDLFTKRALDFLEKPPGRPYFLCLTCTIPHADNELGALKGNGMEVPDASDYSGEQWPDQERNFAAMISRMDRDIGRILDLLKSTGQEQNTVVLFSSDNGPHREGGHNPEYFASSGPLRGIKRDLYEGGIRVPLIARWPGQTGAGTVSEEVVAFWDMLPTLAEIAGTHAPAGIDGRSFVPALRGKPQPPHSPLYWEFHERGFAQAVRLGDWKGVSLAPGKGVELYDLKTDPGERNNVAADHPDVVRKIASIMTASRSESADFPVTV